MEGTKRAKVEMVNDEKKIKLSWEETKEACVTSFLQVVSGRALPMDTSIRYNSLPQSAMCIKVERNMGGLWDAPILKAWAIGPTHTHARDMMSVPTFAQRLRRVTQKIHRSRNTGMMVMAMAGTSRLRDGSGL